MEGINMSVIRVEALSKSYQIKRKKPGFWGSVTSLVAPDVQEKQALESVSFQIKEQERVAFIGPNGAGKSTTIKMLSGILHPSSGFGSVLGFCPWKDRHKLAFHIGTVFGQKSQLWYHLPAMDTFELTSRVYELGRTDYRKRRDELIERFQLQPYLHTPVRKLSLGERMRCEIAAALLHRPKVLFLDEPTIGLDVNAKQLIRELILELNEQEGTIVFLTSHDMGDIEQLCSRAMIINHGRIVLDEKVSSLKRYLQHKMIQLSLKDRGASADLFDLPGVTVLSKGLQTELSVNTSFISIEEVLGYIVQRHRISDITIQDPSLEEVIAEVYAGRERVI
jgi:ABC-2 type transport system ATP-binding protein